METSQLSLTLATQVYLHLSSLSGPDTNINWSCLLCMYFLGYQVGRPVIGGVLGDATGTVLRAPISLWQGGNITSVK